jgi:hypothetical protein
MQLKQTWDMTSLQFYPRIKNGGVARIWGISRISYVGCGASTIRKEKVRYGPHNSFRETWQGRLQPVVILKLLRGGQQNVSKF